MACKNSDPRCGDRYTCNACAHDAQADRASSAQAAAFWRSVARDEQNKTEERHGLWPKRR